MQLKKQTLKHVTEITLRYLSIISLNFFITETTIALSVWIAKFFMDAGTKQDLELYGPYEFTVIAYGLPYVFAGYLLSIIIIYFVSKHIVPCHKNILSIVITIVSAAIYPFLLDYTLFLMIYLIIMAVITVIQHTSRNAIKMYSHKKQ